jgi:hypothetical protein
MWCGVVWRKVKVKKQPTCGQTDTMTDRQTDTVTRDRHCDRQTHILTDHLFDLPRVSRIVDVTTVRTHHLMSAAIIKH